MIHRAYLHQLAIILFMILVGYSLGWAIRSSSWLGISLSFISLAAGFCFIYFLNRLKKEMDTW